MTLFLLALYASVYLLVSGSFALGEWVYAAMVAAMGTALGVTAARIARMDQHVRPAWLARLLRPSVAVVGEVLPLAVALAAALRRRRRVATAFSRRAFDPGASEDAWDRGRRALVTLAVSISPASLVLERDVDCRELTVASIGVPAPAAADPRWPV